MAGKGGLVLPGAQTIEDQVHHRQIMASADPVLLSQSTLKRCRLVAHANDPSTAEQVRSLTLTSDPWRRRTISNSSRQLGCT
jgi:hypothetical protein